MTSSSSRKIDELYEKLAVVFKVPHWWSKSGVRKVLATDTGVIERAIVKTGVFAKTWTNFLEIPKNSVRGNKCGIPRKVFKKLGKGEVRLEKLITASNENVYNQFNLMSGLTDASLDHQTKKMNIDLVVLNDTGCIEEMIELKDRGNPENPIAAMFQLILYLYLFRQAKARVGCGYRDTAKHLRLTVLAPQGYYKRHLCSPLPEALKRITRIVSKQTQTRFSFQEVDLQKSCLGKFEKTLEDMQVGFSQRCKVS